ncbi:VOC family protein [Tateyamaria sp.]|uniref:VOC family protein n=1 Tax=Tateyamaria sp. TaxID=1929288 RepID=UPI00329C14C2
MPCTSLEQQMGFYRDVLGFSVEFQAQNYAFIRRDDVALRLVEVWETVNLSHPEREGSFYVDVEGLDDLFALMKPKLESLPEGRVRLPFDQDYGQREFHVKDEDCTLIFFGEAL